MQVGDTRYNSDDIRRLYESSDYPLRRRIRRNALTAAATRTD